LQQKECRNYAASGVSQTPNNHQEKKGGQPMKPKEKKKLLELIIKAVIALASLIASIAQLIEALR